MSIILIDNDKLLASTCIKLFKTRGYGVVWCKSAHDAIKQADLFLPKAVILEINLAQHNGIEFLYEFRSYPEWQKVPIIIYSWVPQKSLKINPSTWNALNISEYIYKPTGTLRQLMRLLSKYVPAKV